MIITTTSKTELARMFGISISTLTRLLNVTYFEKLEIVGYQKTQKLLYPKQIQKFYELHGTPTIGIEE